MKTTAKLALCAFTLWGATALTFAQQPSTSANPPLPAGGAAADVGTPSAQRLDTEPWRQPGSDCRQGQRSRPQLHDPGCPGWNGRGADVPTGFEENQQHQSSRFRPDDGARPLRPERQANSHGDSARGIPAYTDERRRHGHVEPPEASERGSLRSQLHGGAESRSQ